MNKQLTILLFFYFLYSVQALGQFNENNTIHFTVKDGLPSSTVYKIIQDRNGFIWIATEAGLAMFDGSSFKTYTTKDGLPDNEVLSLFCDSLNRTWITPYKKNPAYIFNYKIHNEDNDTLIRHIAALNKEEFISGNNTSNHNWLYKSKLYQLGKDRLRQIPLSKSFLRVLYVEDISSDSSIIYTNNGFFLFSNNSITLLPFLPAGISFESIEVISRSGKYLQLGYPVGILIYECNGTTFSLLQKINYPHAGRNLFIGPVSGNNFCYGLAGEKIIYISNPFSSGIQITEIPLHANDVFADKEKNIWVSTADDGVYMLPAKQASVINVSSGLLSDNVQNVFTNHQQEIFLGNSNGALEKIDAAGHVHTISSPIGDRFIRSRGMAGDEDDLFVLNDKHFGRYSFLQQKMSYPYLLPEAPKSLFYSPVNHTIIIGDVTGFSIISNYDFEHRKSVVIKKRVTAVCETTGKQLFFGSTDGLYQYQNNEAIYLGNLSPLLKCRITALTADSNNITWAATSSNGIYAFKNNKILYQVSADTNLSFVGNMCRAIKIMNDKVWVATNAGINCIDYTGSETITVKSVTSYSVNDGLPSDDINDIFVRDSFLYAATTRGLGILNYLSVPALVKIPVYITSVLIDNKPAEIKSSYELAYSQNNLSIKYSGIWFHQDGKIRYRYRLQDKDADWVYTELSSLELLSLAPGNYHLQIQASHKNDFIQSSSTDIFITIAPPYYASWWFRILLLLFGAGLLLGATALLFRRRNNRRKQIEQLNNQVKYYELEALRSQMNPHFIFNSLTAVQHFINVNDAANANKYIAEFAKLIRKTLNNSRQSFISLDKEIQYLENYISLEQMRFLNSFDFSIECDESINTFNTTIPCMLLQPYLENAVRHGLRPLTERRGRLEVKFMDSKDSIVCTIDDNGIGRAASAAFNSGIQHENESKGMLIAEERIKTLNTLHQTSIKIEVKDKVNDMGTIIIVTFFKSN